MDDGVPMRSRRPRGTPFPCSRRTTFPKEETPCPLSSNRPPWENHDLSKQVVLLTSYHDNMVIHGGTLSYLRLLEQRWHR
jgi:hypothetical protein